jgi:hypothetical protein
VKRDLEAKNRIERIWFPEFRTGTIVYEVSKPASNGLEIVSMNTKQPTLEDALVKYTGLDAVQVERMEFLRPVKTRGQRG